MKIARLLILAIVCSVGSSACDCNGRFRFWSEQPRDVTASAEPVVFESEQAPYTVELPGGWRLESDESLNKHADLRANKNNRLFLIVIPQDLPSIKGVDSPGVEELKKASIERMSQNVDNLQIEREGPVTMEKADALSVFANARTEDGEVQYVATYVTRGSWGYQIIAWGPAAAKSELVDSVDRVIKGWQFTSDSLPSGAADARSVDAPEQSSD